MRPGEDDKRQETSPILQFLQGNSESPVLDQANITQFFQGNPNITSKQISEAFKQFTKSHPGAKSQSHNIAIIYGWLSQNKYTQDIDVTRFTELFSTNGDLSDENTQKVEEIINSISTIKNDGTELLQSIFGAVAELNFPQNIFQHSAMVQAKILASTKSISILAGVLSTTQNAPYCKSFLQHYLGTDIHNIDAVKVLLTDLATRRSEHAMEAILTLKDYSDNELSLLLKVFDERYDDFGKKNLLQRVLDSRDDDKRYDETQQYISDQQEAKQEAEAKQVEVKQVEVKQEEVRPEEVRPEEVEQGEIKQEEADQDNKHIKKKN
jgi:hypothetical protein